jgi:sec-independent protein translocase protein TatA
MFRNPTTDLIVVLVIVLLIFGPKRLPGLGRQLGQGLKEFKDSITGDSKQAEEERPALDRAPEQAKTGTPGAHEPAPADEATTPAEAQPPAQASRQAEVGSERSS